MSRNDANTDALAVSAYPANEAEGAKGARLALRLALRELRGGLRGFYIFIACIALGVAAISGVNSVARSITGGIAEQGQAILGGDFSLSLVQQQLSEEQRDFLDGLGRVSHAATLRGMARLSDGTDQTLVEIKAVDSAYPLYGELQTDSGTIAPGALAEDTLLIERLLGERLGVAPGDRLVIGTREFVIEDFIAEEPDRLSSGFGFGPRVLMTMSALAQSELLQPGSLVTNHWKIRLSDPTPAGLEAATAALAAAYPEAGWRLRSRDNAAPALSRNITRFSDFLTLVGLAALIVGGVGVANAVRAFLETKRPVIAIFKSLGAPGHLIFLIYLFQILVISLAGIAIGLVLGALMPVAAGWALSGLLPLPQSGVIYFSALALGAVYGLVTAVTFAIWPLGIAREVPATDLFRGEAGGVSLPLPRGQYLIALGLCVALLAGLSILLSENRFVAGVFVGGIAFAFLLLRLVAVAVQKLAAAAPKPRSTEWRMAVTNIYRPGSLTQSVVLALGLGLALLVCLALIDGNLRQQVSGNLPERAPDFFFVDVQNGDKETFEELLAEIAPEGKVFSVPMLRGRIISLKGIAAEDYPVADGGAWVLRGDRGITYAENVPENATLAAGDWWPADYAGEPLVSFSAEEAAELGLNVGDPITVNVLGRNITAKIASLREVEWESLAINFVMVFSPNTFAGAPHAHLATLTLGDADAAVAGDVVRRVAEAFPGVTSVRVREALERVNGLIAQLATAIRAAASVTLAASVLVLGGALAAGNRARVHDAVVLKTLGATRGRLIRAFVYEYALLGFATALFALLAGGVAAWFVITQIMTFDYVFQPVVAIVTIAAALVLTVGFGLVGTWRILGQKAAPVLREL